MGTTLPALSDIDRERAGGGGEEIRKQLSSLNATMGDKQTDTQTEREIAYETDSKRERQEMGH